MISNQMTLLKSDITGDDERNGISIFERNQSNSSWNLSNGQMYANDCFIFEEYMTNTLLSMGYNQLQIDSVLPQIDCEKQVNFIERAIQLLNPMPTAQVLNSEQEEKEAIIRQKTLHFTSIPISSEQLILSNSDLKSIVMDMNEDIGDKIECIICCNYKNEDAFWKNMCQHDGVICTECTFSYFQQNIIDGRVDIFCLHPKCAEFIDEAAILSTIKHDIGLTAKYKQ